MPTKECVTCIIDDHAFATDKRIIRLAKADTSEKGERDAISAIRRLKWMISDKGVSATPVAKDRYGRTVTKAKVGNRSV